MTEKTVQQLLEEVALIIHQLGDAAQKINMTNSQLAQSLKQATESVSYQVGRSAQAAQDVIVKTIVNQLESTLTQKLNLIDQRHEAIFRSQEQGLANMQRAVEQATRAAKYLTTKNMTILISALAIMIFGGCFLMWQGGAKIMEQSKTLDNIELHKKLKINNCDNLPCKVADKAYKKGDIIDLSQ